MKYKINNHFFQVLRQRTLMGMSQASFACRNIALLTATQATKGRPKKKGSLLEREREREKEEQYVHLLQVNSRGQ